MILLTIALAFGGPADLAGEALAFELGLDGVRGAAAEVGPAWVSACRAGYKPACALDTRVPMADGGRDPARVLEALAGPCGPKDAVACLADGVGRAWFAEPADVGGALAALDAGCKAKLERACVEAARVRLPGAGGDALTASCGRGFAPACALAGDMHREAGPDQLGAAEAAYQKGCDGGSAVACTGLAEVRVERGDFAGAVGLLERSCGAGHAWGCAVLGDLWDQGAAGPRDAAKALALFDQACGRGLGFGCNAAGTLLDVGADGVTIDEAGASARYVRACAVGMPDGCYNLGLQIEGGEAAPRPLVEGALGGGALDWFRLGCEGGLVASCAASARHEPDPTLARQLRERACADGAALACEDLAVAALAADPKAAAAGPWLSAACEAGRPTACVRLAALRDEAGDAAGARAALTPACAAGDPDGCAALGRMRDQGQGGDADLVGAVAAWRVACLGGRADACNDLGANLAEGRGADRDPVAAAAAFERACAAGVVPACGNLGVLRVVGDGAPADPVGGVALLDQACAGGHAPSCVRLGVVLAKGLEEPPLAKDKKRAKASFARACTLGDASACGRKR